jgi:hypothetical protein
MKSEEDKEKVDSEIQNFSFVLHPFPRKRHDSNFHLRFRLHGIVHRRLFSFLSTIPFPSFDHRFRLASRRACRLRFQLFSLKIRNASSRDLRMIVTFQRAELEKRGDSEREGGNR